MKKGDKFEMVWPFKKYDSLQPKDNAFVWASGCFVYSEHDGGYGYNHSFFCNEEGKITYKVIKVVKMPKPYIDRVFFQKQLIDPSGIKNKTTTECLSLRLFEKHISSRTPFKVEYEIDSTIKGDFDVREEW